MFVELRKDDPRPVYRQIADELQRAVSVGVLKPGESLPATRQLAAELKLNPNTVQHAYRTLVQEGVDRDAPRAGRLRRGGRRDEVAGRSPRPSPGRSRSAPCGRRSVTGCWRAT